jgi:hypothetical protein
LQLYRAVSLYPRHVTAEVLRTAVKEIHLYRRLVFSYIFMHVAEGGHMKKPKRVALLENKGYCLKIWFAINGPSVYSTAPVF